MDRILRARRETGCGELVLGAGLSGLSRFVVFWFGVLKLDSPVSGESLAWELHLRGPHQLCGGLQRFLPRNRSALWVLNTCLRPLSSVFPAGIRQTQSQSLFLPATCFQGCTTVSETALSISYLLCLAWSNHRQPQFLPLYRGRG